MMNNTKEGKKKVVDEIISWIMALAFAVILALFINTFILNTTKVEGSSMYPTLKDEDRLISMKIVLLFRDPKKEDIVIFQSPIRPEDDYIKRVIGVEGDEVRLDEDGYFYVNGKKYEEYYIAEGTKTYPGRTGNTSWKVGENELFVVGDNRQYLGSTDSREFGPILKDSVRGIAVFRYYPINRMGVIN